MADPVLIAWLGFAGAALAAAGVLVGHLLTARSARRTADAQARAAVEAQKLAAEAQKATAENNLIDQLQEELGRYREATDLRLDRLEQENRGYRAFIGIQRDHMAAHGVPLPDWPEGLPR